VPTANFRFRSAIETTNFAESVAPHLGAGDVILLEGGLGAGKSHFARGVIQARQTVAEDVPSPTFTLVQTYDVGDLEIWHADLYRLNSPDEAFELGLEDALEDSICLIEWPDRLAEATPANALQLRFEMTSCEDEREAFATYDDPKWARILPGE